MIKGKIVHRILLAGLLLAPLAGLHAALPAAAAGRLRRGVRHRGGLQRADCRGRVRIADRAGKFFDEPFCAAGFFIGHRGDGVAQFFRH